MCFAFSGSSLLGVAEKRVYVFEEYDDNLCEYHSHPTQAWGLNAQRQQRRIEWLTLCHAQQAYAWQTPVSAVLCTTQCSQSEPAKSYISLTGDWSLTALNRWSRSSDHRFHGCQRGRSGRCFYRATVTKWHRMKKSRSLDGSLKEAM